MGGEGEREQGIRPAILFHLQSQPPYSAYLHGPGNCRVQVKKQRTTSWYKVYSVYVVYTVYMHIVRRFNAMHGPILKYNK